MKLTRKYKILIITGLSGAGRSTALKIFEDMGYEAIDNLPTALISNILDTNIKKKIAVGIDIRSRGFNAKKLSNLISKKRKKIDISVIFFDCDNINLINRFKENRRTHPLKLDLPMEDMIDRERTWLEPLKKMNDVYIDTSGFSVNILRKQLEGIFNVEFRNKIHVRVISFGYKYGLPREADLVFDMRFIRNPFYIKKLSKLTGEDDEVKSFIKKQTNFNFFFETISPFFDKIISGYKEEGKNYITIAFGCTGGVHRSVVSAINFYATLKENNKLEVHLDHRDLNK